MNFSNAAFELSAALASQLVKSDLPEIVFSGKSNVGKSSLINKILNRKNLARTSSTPGKTASINFYKLDKCRFADFPGYGYAKVSAAEKKRWASLTNGYFESKRKVALILQIVDMRHELTDNDCDMIDFLISSEYPFLIVCTKSDKLNATQRKKQTEYFNKIFSENGYSWLPFSSQNGENVDMLRSIIKKHCEIV